MKKKTAGKWDVIDYLVTKEEIILYLTTAFKENDLTFELKALNSAKRALKAIHEKANITD